MTVVFALVSRLFSAFFYHELLKLLIKIKIKICCILSYLKLCKNCFHLEIVIIFTEFVSIISVAIYFIGSVLITLLISVALTNDRVCTRSVASMECPNFFY